jgi:WD40 repeat protein
MCRDGLPQTVLTGTGITAVDLVAVSPDGRTLASGSAEGATRLWNLNVQDAIGRICATAGGLTLRQWNEYISQLRYQPLCAHWRHHRVIPSSSRGTGSQPQLRHDYKILLDTFTPHPHGRATC